MPNRVHIPHLEIDKLASQAESGGIFSFAETPSAALNKDAEKDALFCINSSFSIFILFSY